MQTLEKFKSVVSQILMINPVGVCNKTVLRSAIDKTNEYLDGKLHSPHNDTMAVKQLLMDVGKKKRNSTSGVRQPAWLLELFSKMRGCGDEDEDEDEPPQHGASSSCSSIVPVISVVHEMPVATTVPKNLAAPPLGWQRVPGTRVLLERISDASDPAGDAGIKKSRATKRTPQQ